MTSDIGLKREMAAFLQELTRQQPVILFFDDLHWADASTVDMLSYVAAQFRSMPLVIIVTYRPTEMLLSRHPFLSVKLELAGRGSCREVVLEYLTTADIERYLNLLFPKHGPAKNRPAERSRPEIVGWRERSRF